MKRFYVRPAFRRSGRGELAKAVVAAARDTGTPTVLDTLPSMAQAQALYRSLGFVTGL